MQKVLLEENLQLSCDEIKGLLNKEIKMRFTDSIVSGRIKQSSTVNVDGYSFIYELDDRTIVELGNIFPVDLSTVNYPFKDMISRIFRTEQEEVYAVSTAFCSFHYKNGYGDYGKLNNFLNQQTFDF